MCVGKPNLVKDSCPRLPLDLVLGQDLKKKNKYKHKHKPFTEAFELVILLLIK